MSSKSSTVRHKNQATVKITLAGQEPFDAIVFLAMGDRLIDLLNDDRHFIPVQRKIGDTIIVAKTQIVSIVENDSDIVEEALEPPEAQAAPKKKFDPYESLRVTPEASIDEIRSAYRARLKAVHPDSIAALGLDDDLAKAALLATQKVTYAYRKIMQEREALDDASLDEPIKKAAS